MEKENTDKPKKLDFRDKSRHISTDGYICENTKDEIGLIRSDCPIPPVGNFYFEFEILKYDKKSKVSIGVCLKSNVTSTLPGYDKNSFGIFFSTFHTKGYRSTDGNKCLESINGEPYGSSYEEGDFVGVFVNFLTNSIFFTKNGIAFGEAFQGISKLNLYPCVGLLFSKVRVNFGKEEFKFDVSPILKESKQFIYKQIEKDNILFNEINFKDIILEYLYKNGYTETCEKLGKKIEKSDSRKMIMNSIQTGDYLDSIELISKYYPNIVDHVMFHLKSQIFIEMEKNEDALKFAQRELSPFMNSKYEKDLMRIFSLITLHPSCEMKDSIETQRERLSNFVNETILKDENLDPNSSLLKMMKQLKFVSSLNFGMDLEIN
jgi:hypothetical protein